MRKLPAEAASILDAISAHIPRLLGQNLVGIYPYGSITNSSFNPKRSDIDCIVVTNCRISDPQFRRLKAWFGKMLTVNEWVNQLQISFLIKDKLLEWSDPSTTPPDSCLYQFGKLQRCGSDGNPLIWLDHLRTGKALAGPKAQSFLPKITHQLVARALKRELGYLGAELADRTSKWRDVPMYRAYATLTICRILYTHSEATVVSKKMAAAWTIRTYPELWNAIIKNALDFNETGVKVEIPLRSLRTFLEFAARKLDQ